MDPPPCPSQPALAPAPPAPPATTRVLRFGETAIECLIWGHSGTPVVLLPGLGGDALQFGPLPGLLASAGYRAVGVNPRGAGASRGPLRNLTLHDFAKDVRDVLQALDWGPAHILGRAFGNRLARVTATDYPEWVRSVILLAAGGAVPADPEAAAAFRRVLDPALPEVERRAAAALALFSPASTIRPDLEWRAWPEATAAQLFANQATSPELWWRAGRAPLLIIQGLDDRLAPPANGRLLLGQVGRRARLVEIAEAGHALLFEQPARVSAEILAFLREQSEATAQHSEVST